MKWVELTFVILVGIFLFPTSFAVAEGTLTKSSRINLSAYQRRTAYENIDVQAIQHWESYDQVYQYFLLLRDTRFIHDPKVEGVYRRISWMLPDFGCNARAASAIELLKKYTDLPLPNKLFIFGDPEYRNLSVKSPFSPTKRVEWVDHVALVVRVENQIYVLDPSVELSRPLELAAWISAITNETKNLWFSVCHHDTFDPLSRCQHPQDERKRAVRQQNTCLDLERKRVKKLGLDPAMVLGDLPPWLN